MGAITYIFQASGSTGKIFPQGLTSTTSRLPTVLDGKLGETHNGAFSHRTMELAVNALESAFETSTNRGLSTETPPSGDPYQQRRLPMFWPSSLFGGHLESYEELPEESSASVYSFTPCSFSLHYAAAFAGPSAGALSLGAYLTSSPKSGGSSRSAQVFLLADCLESLVGIIYFLIHG